MMDLWFRWNSQIIFCQNCPLCVYLLSYPRHFFWLIRFFVLKCCKKSVFKIFIISFGTFYIHIYIYMCVCVCMYTYKLSINVCMYVKVKSTKADFSWETHYGSKILLDKSFSRWCTSNKFISRKFESHDILLPQRAVYERSALEISCIWYVIET